MSTAFDDPFNSAHLFLRHDFSYNSFVFLKLMKMTAEYFKSGRIACHSKHFFLSSNWKFETLNGVTLNGTTCQPAPEKCDPIYYNSDILLKLTTQKVRQLDIKPTSGAKIIRSTSE